MAQRRPYVSYAKYHYDADAMQYKFNKGVTLPTYAEVKKRMAEFLKESDDNMVRVYRERRGEFGEWFEHWQLNLMNNPVIVKQGWMIKY